MFPARTPQTETVGVSQTFFRIVRKKYAATALSFRRSKSRFCTSFARYKVIYAADDPATAVFETIVRNTYVGASTPPAVSRIAPLYDIYEFSLSRSVDLIDLTEERCAAQGLHSDVVYGDHYRLSQPAASDIYAHASGFDGIVWKSRFTQRKAYVLFDRPSLTVSFSASHDLSRDAGFKGFIGAGLIT
ncbi:MAG: RES family NAD+ phosphorylase [Maricaulaceae bacterium]